MPSPMCNRKTGGIQARSLIRPCQQRRIRIAFPEGPLQELRLELGLARFCGHLM
jgi:hypothetical protein